MRLDELLDIASDIRFVLSESRKTRGLTFEEESHKYSILDASGNEVSDLPSVSTLLKNWCTPFDTVSKSLEMCNNNEILAEQLRNEWELKGTHASSIGSYVHYKLEQYLWNAFDIEMETRKPIYNLDQYQLNEALSMVETGVNLINTIIGHGFVPIETECVMGSLPLGYFGQADNIWLGHMKKSLVLLMTDHKTNQSKNFKNKPYNKPMHTPFESLLDTDLSKYYIQQPLYAQLFKDMLAGSKYENLDFIGFRIIHVRDGGEIIKIPNWVYNEVKKIYPL